MQFKKASLLGISALAAITAFSACSDDNNSDVPVAPPIDNPTPSDTTAPGPVPADTTIPGPTPTDTTTQQPQQPSTNIPTTTGLGVMLDDFEDGDGNSLLGEGWYTYNDADNGGGSIITTPVVDDNGYPLPAPADNGTLKAFQVNYSLNKADYEYDPYVGWGVQMPTDIDYSKFGGISYWYKGGKHEIHVETSDVKDYDVHLATFKASRTWTQATIRFKDLTQGGWGEEVAFDPTHIVAVSFQAKGNKIVDSLIVDNIYLMDTSEVEPDQKDLTINDPVIPTVTIGDVAINTPLQEKAMKFLNKGVSFTNWLEEDKSKFDGKFQIGKSDLEILAASGFKAVRLPIDLDLYATNRDEFIADSTVASLAMDTTTLFTVLDSFVDWTRELGLSLTIDYHEYDNSYNKTSASNPRYNKMMALVWKTVAAHYAANEREDIFYELLNEPDMSDGKVTADQWTVTAQGIIDSIRTVDKTHTLLFGDVQWYSIDKLAKRTPFTDANIIYVIHTYEPFVFTHQSANWTNYKTIKNIPFPYTKETWSEYSADFGMTKSSASDVKSAIKNYYKNGSKEAILKNIYKAKEWAVKNQVPVIINEFGAYNLKSTAQSRLNYLTAMREISDTLQIPLTHWGYTGGFSVIENGKLIEGIGEALGLGK